MEIREVGESLYNSLDMNTETQYMENTEMFLLNFKWNHCTIVGMQASIPPVCI